MSAVSDSFVFVPKPERPKPDHPSLKENYKPGSAASYAHDWSNAGIGIHGRHFIDAHGRACHLRGVNLSGSCKTPVNDDHATFPAGAELTTFVGRPFPLEEAHEHLSRLRRWGFTFIRFLVTWEAVEHAGPGKYDMEYLNYIRELLSLFPKYGMSAFVALHQDVWSRYTGGSGAPAWTVEAMGLDLQKLEETHAAWLLGVKGGGHVESERGLWPCGYQKLAASTASTCFWAGNTFAPKLLIEDSNGNKLSIQDYLQNAFLDMYELLARTVGDLDAVLGFEIMNEPHRGYIDIGSLYEFDYNTDLHLSFIPSPFESFQLGAGYPTKVTEWVRSFPMPTRKSKSSILNPNGSKAWREDGPTHGQCLWKLHGVWDYDTNKNRGVVLRENYFKNDPVTGQKIDWYTDFYYPFLRKWSERVRSASSPSKLLFVEPIPNEFCPKSWTAEHRLPNMVYAPHWYDLNALFQKAFGDFSVNVQGLSRGMFPLKAFYWGQKGARDNFALQIQKITEEGYRSLGETPVLIGECGVPMDLNRGQAFETGDFSWQSRMMDAMITGLEQALVGFTLWNYNPYNSDTEGDDWNGENFSWFSRRRALPSSLLSYEQTAPTLDNGGRILTSVVRPYPAKTAGIPLSFRYEMNTGSFTFKWANPLPRISHETEDLQWAASVTSPPLFNHPPITSLETEIFIPSSLSSARKIIIDGLGPEDTYLHDESRQTLFIVKKDRSPACTHTLSVSFDPPLEAEFPLEDWWSAFGTRAVSVLVLLLSIFLYWTGILRQ